jgi:alpha-L-glutamate ligase-like protein
MKISSILGINARTQLFAYRYNTKRGKAIADSKIQTAAAMRLVGVPNPKIYKKFRNLNDINEYDWNLLPDKFALKPSQGLGGEGIIVIKKKLKDGTFLTTNKQKVNVSDLKLHIIDILEGAYSMGNVPDTAFIQEYVGRVKVFRKWAFRGTPDIRIIIFNKVPVMAMLRLPTRESGGRANLHQGALGVGIDMATGITTRAIWHGEPIVFKPGTENKLRGIKIPSWDRILETAVRAQMGSHLGYLGVDMVIHPDKGPMVLELNAQPGLQIQLANGEGLRRRLERIMDLDVGDAEHGITIGKSLFANRFADRKKFEEGIKTIAVWEKVKIKSKDSKTYEFYAKVDTGAWRTSIDKDLAKKMGFLDKSNILWSRKIRTSLGKEDRQVINLKFTLSGRKIETMASVSSRKNLRVPLIIGRRDLAGFLVTPYSPDKSLPWVPPMWKLE